MHCNEPEYLCHLRNHLLGRLNDPAFVRWLRPLLESLLLVAHIDLEPVRDLISAAYASRAGGRPPRQPLAVLRSLLFMNLLGYTSVDRWVAVMGSHPDWPLLCGFSSGEPRPGVGTLYDFCARLLDGNFQPACPHRQRPSSRFRGVRNRFRRQLKKEKQDLRAAGMSGDDAVRRKVQAALPSTDEPPPQDFAGRLERLLLRCGVLPSLKDGLLDNVGHVSAAADGSLLASQAHGRGRPLCSCARDGLPTPCACERLYADPDATWGYDSYRETYVFGYRLHVVAASVAGTDLPLHLFCEGAHVPDPVLGVDAFSRLRRLLRAEAPEVRIRDGIHDTGYDATAYYQFLRHLGIRAIIPLHPNTRTPSDADHVPRDDKGHPLCPAGLRMRFHGTTTAAAPRQVFHCPVKRPGRELGKLLFRTHREECPQQALCEPASKMGPLVYLSHADDPRLNPEVPRSVPLWKSLYRLRTCTERFFSSAKLQGHLDRRPWRRKHLFHIFATLHALGIHARARIRKRFGRLPETLEGGLAMLRTLLATEDAPVPA